MQDPNSRKKYLFAFSEEVLLSTLPLFLLFDLEICLVELIDIESSGFRQIHLGACCNDVRRINSPKRYPIDFEWPSNEDGVIDLFEHHNTFATITAGKYNANCSGCQLQISTCRWDSHRRTEFRRSWSLARFLWLLDVVCRIPFGCALRGMRDVARLAILGTTNLFCLGRRHMEGELETWLSTVMVKSEAEQSQIKD
jgi:hypothetical protein